MQPQPSVPVSAGDAISYGWAAFKKYPGPLIVIMLVIWAINLAFGVVAAVIADDAWVLRLVLQLAAFLVSVLLSMGLIRVALKATAGQEPDMSDLFVTDNFGNYLVVAIIFGLMVGIGLALCIVPGILLAIAFFPCLYLAVDKRADIGTALSRATQLTRNHWGPLFGFMILAFLLNLLGALLCGIGLLVTYPITIVAGGYMYRAIAGEPIAPIPA